VWRGDRVAKVSDFNNGLGSTMNVAHLGIHIPAETDPSGTQIM